MANDFKPIALTHRRNRHPYPDLYPGIAIFSIMKSVSPSPLRGEGGGEGEGEPKPLPPHLNPLPPRGEEIFWVIL